jgi:hypothetical protein
MWESAGFSIARGGFFLYNIQIQEPEQAQLTLRLAVISMRKQSKNLPVPPIFLLAVVALAIFLLVAFGGRSGDQEAQQEISAGIAYLESLERKDPAVVQNIRKEIRAQQIAEQRDELLSQLETGEIDPFSMFRDYVIMGDSRAVGYWYRDFLDKGRVLADGGHTIRNISEQMDTLVSLNPATVYLCYGLNDISIGYWDTAESYVAEYISLVKQIRERLPNATVVVSSILPARDPAFERSAKWRNIPDWSKVLEAACKENNILFANCDDLAEDYPKLWDPDGIHFRKEFYPYWASRLVVTTLMEE